MTSYIENQALRDVRDGAPVGRAKEGVAWLMTWKKILNKNQESKTQPERVTQLQLNSQPKSFRGKQVVFRGHVRSAKLQTVENHELGIQKYFILWVKPEEKSTFPYCVYALNLPKGFPDVQRDAVELNEKVEISGRFFKVRSYQAQSGLRECPLVLADTPTWFPDESKNNLASSIDYSSWPFQSVFLLLLVGCLLVFAVAVGGLAYWISRATSGPRVVSPSEEAKVSEGIQDLQKNPAVETVSDRLRKMSENS